jgi:hypothetical protein
LDRDDTPPSGLKLAEEKGSEIEKSEVGIDTVRVERRRRRKPAHELQGYGEGDSVETFNRASHSR